MTSRGTAGGHADNRGKHTLCIHTHMGKRGNGRQAGNTAETNQTRRENGEPKLTPGWKTLQCKTGNTNIEPKTLDTTQGTPKHWN